MNGKTRLADEISRYARERGMRTIWGRCWAGGGAPPFWPWVQLFRAGLVLSQPNASTASSIRMRRRSPISFQKSHLYPGYQLYPNCSHRLQAIRKKRAFDSAARLLKNAARATPLLMVLDDLHDADRTSLLLIRFIARELKEAPVLLLGNFREGEVRASPVLRRLIGELAHEGHEIPLWVLNDSEISELIGWRIGASLDEPVITRLRQATGGNPLFLDGVLRALLSTGKEIKARVLSQHDFQTPMGSRRQSVGTQ
jgi:eukaryotic-like serine/threonine-protein kinase